MVTVTEAVDVGDDVLLVRGHVEGIYEVDSETGQPTDTLALVEARGWVSATTNHYPPADYDDAGNLRPGAKARAMTRPEVRVYAERILAEACGLRDGPSRHRSIL